MSLKAFTDCIASALLAGSTGLLLSGDRGRIIIRAVVLGRVGDSFLEDTRRTDVHVFLMANPRHHPVPEHFEGGVPILSVGPH